MTRIGILTQEETPRLRYIIRLIMERLGVSEFRIFNNLDDFTRYNVDVKINYRHEPLEGTFHIRPCGILSERGLQTFTPPHYGKGAEFILFPDEESALGFDVFGACFWILSRYEEYGNFTPDTHGRFPHEASLLHECEVLPFPIIDIWLKNLATRLGLSSKKNQFKVITTVDIDQLFLWKNKGLRRQMALIFRNLGNMRALGEIFAIAGGQKVDVYDRTAEIAQNCRQNESKALFFLHLGDYGPHDKNIPFNAGLFKKTLEAMKNQAKTGIHPSYRASYDTASLTIEFERFRKVFGEAPRKSRQHYLRFNLPDTYERLIENGIHEEYSMGYSTTYGFRAGTAFPFRWYHLKNEQETDLRIYPFEVMDVYLRFILKCNASAALTFLNDKMSAARLDGRPFCWAIHNESWSGFGAWQGWDTIFKALLSGRRTE